jgi:hypothetical protein
MTNGTALVETVSFENLVREVFSACQPAKRYILISPTNPLAWERD